jgi:hypothetical protein
MGKTSQKTTNTVYGNTTTSNPYAWAKTNNAGTLSGFQDGSALNSVYNFVNGSIDSLLEQYLNPSLNSTTNQAKLNAFSDTLNRQTRSNLENSVINPLSKRNMLRSSQASDLYNNLSNQNISAIAEFANNLLANSQKDTADMLTNLLSYYMQGANYLSGMQNQSLQTSKGNASTTSQQSNNLLETLIPLAVNSALKISGL